MNQAELTAKYCINKAKPMLKCNGKCYLAKQLKKQEEQDKAEFNKKSKSQVPKFKKIKDENGNVLKFKKCAKKGQVRMLHNMGHDLEKAKLSRAIKSVSSVV